MDKKMMHREAIKKFLSNIYLQDKQVIDWCSGSKPAFRYIQHQGCTFTTVDNASGIPQDRRGKYHINADVSLPIAIPRDDLKKFDVAFALEALEHVEYPEQLIRNIRASLGDGALLYLSAPFKYNIHADADYWRFTSNGLELLLKRNGFKIVTIQETVDELGYIVEAQSC